jgi:hypothetical protein
MLVLTDPGGEQPPVPELPPQDRQMKPSSRLWFNSFGDVG